MNIIKEALQNILEYMISLLTGAYTQVDERNAAKALPLETYIGKLFATYGWGLSVIKDSADNSRLWADIDHAKGIILERHGKNFGVERGGANDDFYRLMIRVKLLSQLSNGDIETIISAVSGLYEIDLEYVELYEIFPAKIQIAIAENSLPPGSIAYKDLIGELTKRLLGHGIGMDMIYKEEDIAKGVLYQGGKVVSEFTRIRLSNYLEEPEDLSGIQYIGGKIVSEFTRIRLSSAV